MVVGPRIDPRAGPLEKEPCHRNTPDEGAKAPAQCRWHARTRAAAMPRSPMLDPAWNFTQGPFPKKRLKGSAKISQNVKLLASSASAPRCLHRHRHRRQRSARRPRGSARAHSNERRARLTTATQESQHVPIRGARRAASRWARVRAPLRGCRKWSAWRSASERARVQAARAAAARAPPPRSRPRPPAPPGSGRRGPAVRARGWSTCAPPRHPPQLPEPTFATLRDDAARRGTLGWPGRGGGGGTGRAGRFMLRSGRAAPTHTRRCGAASRGGARAPQPAHPLSTGGGTRRVHLVREEGRDVST